MLVSTHLTVSPICHTCSIGPEDKNICFSLQESKGVMMQFGVEEVISKACEIDHAGDAILEFLLILPDQGL